MWELEWLAENSLLILPLIRPREGKPCLYMILDLRLPNPTLSANCSSRARPHEPESKWISQWGLWDQQRSFLVCGRKGSGGLRVGSICCVESKEEDRDPFDFSILPHALFLWGSDSLWESVVVSFYSCDKILEKDFGSQFHRFQSKINWIHCFGSEARQNVLAVGAHGGGGCWPHKSQEAEKEPQSKSALTGFLLLIPSPENFHHLPTMPSNYEVINQLTYTLSQSPGDPIASHWLDPLTRDQVFNTWNTLHIQTITGKETDGLSVILALQREALCRGPEHRPLPSLGGQGSCLAAMMFELNFGRWA
jgi:hypothetical protein